MSGSFVQSNPRTTTMSRQWGPRQCEATGVPAVSTAVQSRVTKTVSVAQLLNN